MTDISLIPGGPLSPDERLPIRPTDTPTEADRVLQREYANGGVLPPNERGEDPAREGAMESLTRGQSRPLSHDEKQAAKHDDGRPAHNEKANER